jgi:hypothetical protein
MSKQSQRKRRSRSEGKQTADGVQTLAEADFQAAIKASDCSNLPQTLEKSPFAIMVRLEAWSNETDRKIGKIDKCRFRPDDSRSVPSSERLASSLRRDKQRKQKRPVERGLHRPTFH